VSGFLRGTDQVQDALTDTVRDLDRVADAGEESARDLARAYDRATDSIKRDTREAGRQSRRDFADAGQEAGDEFAQNLGESVASGDISGLLSGTVGGLVGTFGKGGPVAIAIASLAGVGVGVFQAWQQAAEDAATAAQTAFDQLKEGASDQAKLQQVLSDRFGSYVGGLEQLERYSAATGISVDDLARGLVKGGPAARRIADSARETARQFFETEGSLGKNRRLLTDMADDYEDRADSLERAARAAQTERDALGASEAILRRSARYYAQRGSAYAAGGSTYNSQVPRYARGTRKGRS
jgi:hypothetical protein